ncbi:CG0192-related protein [Crystallibacter degradans]|uniref:CG0192-related protein n=1 Tax=Crystallibacter degradans TaxID=2726743 RepID=UPI0014734190|nr:hypothetical protein [Arthrobacter sp. SF27]NMR29070.1 hypothetical protein [Arthrobacter sp. SF27]
MAIIYDAVLNPSKIDLLASWLPAQPWFPHIGEQSTDEGEPLTLEPIGAYRFDDPTGDVGMEVHLLRLDDGTILQVPLTYRGAPLDDAEPWLAGTMEHSVLGKRWVYDACGDPVFAVALATAILQGGTEAEQFLDKDGTLEPLERSVTVRGSGTPGTEVPQITTAVPATLGAVTTITAGLLALSLYRIPVADEPGTHGNTLAGTWGGHAPVVLASIP